MAKESEFGASGIVHVEGPCQCGHEHTALKHVHAGTHEEDSPTLSDRSLVVSYLLEAVFLAVAALLLILGQEPGLHALVGDLAITFVAIITEALPFMLLGSLVGGVIEVFVPQDWVQKTLGTRTYTAVFIGAAMGITFPVCECAIVPIVRRLLHKGVPLSGALAFLLGGPIVNPIVAGSTWLAYRGDWEVVLVRMVCGYVIAVSVALAVQFLFRNTAVLVDEPLPSSSCTCECCGHDHEHSDATVTVARFWAAVQHACDDFFEVGKFLVIGAFVAALARTTVGVEALQNMFSSPVLAIILMMGLAVALNLCSETDAFIAAGFRGVLPDAAQMAFMVLGPMLDMKLLLMYLTLFRKRVIVVLAGLTFTAVLAAMIVLHYVSGGSAGAP